MTAYNIDEVFMWSNVISIDKCYEREIGYILSQLEKMHNLSYAVEQSPSRMWIYLASACENVDAIEKQLYSMLDVVVLCFLKTRYFVDRLSTPICTLTHVRCALICSLVHFDIDFERNIVHKVLCDSLDFNVDGLLSFRLKALVDAWSELCDVAKRLVDVSSSDDELFEIASFITESGYNKNRLVVSNGKIKNLTSRQAVEIVNVFDEEELNLLCAIIKEKPSDIELENTPISNKMGYTLRHLARVIEK